MGQGRGLTISGDGVDGTDVLQAMKPRHPKHTMRVVAETRPGLGHRVYQDV